MLSPRSPGHKAAPGAKTVISSQQSGPGRATGRSTTSGSPVKPGTCRLQIQAFKLRNAKHYDKTPIGIHWYSLLNGPVKLVLLEGTFQTSKPGSSLASRAWRIFRSDSCPRASTRAWSGQEALQSQCC